MEEELPFNQGQGHCFGPYMIHWVTHSGQTLHVAIFVQCCGQRATLKGGLYHSSWDCNGSLSKQGTVWHPGHLDMLRTTKSKARKITDLAKWSCCDKVAVRATGAPEPWKCMDVEGCMSRVCSPLVDASLKEAQSRHFKLKEYLDISINDFERALRIKGRGGTVLCVQGDAELLAFQGDGLLRFLGAKLAVEKGVGNARTMGEGTQLISIWTSNETLSQFAQKMGLNELDGRRASSHELGTMVEALLMICFLKHGLEKAEKVVRSIIEHADQGDLESGKQREFVARKSFVSMCNEWAAQNGYVFRQGCERVGGPDHSPLWRGRVVIEDHLGTTIMGGKGKDGPNKRKAQEDAARKLWVELEKM